MSFTNRRSFLARSAAIAAVPAVAAVAGGTLTGQASAATLADSAPVPPSALPLTNRHLTEHEKANLAVVLQAYRDGEGDSLDPQGFRDLFATDGVLNGIGGVDGQDSLRGTQLSGLIVFLSQFLPDIHRELKKITVSGDVVCIELSIQGTFLGPFQTPIGPIQPTGAKIDFPTADFWYLSHGKIEVFDCHIALPPCSRSWAYHRTTPPPSGRSRRKVTNASSQLLRRSPRSTRGPARASPCIKGGQIAP